MNLQTIRKTIHVRVIPPNDQFKNPVFQVFLYYDNVEKIMFQFDSFKAAHIYVNDLVNLHDYIY